MAALEPWADGRKPSNIAHHPATTAALNADIQSLVASKDRIDTHPLKTVFDSVVTILTLVRDEMVEEVQFVELAQLCSRACRVLETVTRGRDVGSSDDLGRKIEELERIVRQIESAVGEHASGANRTNDFPDHLSGFNNERIVAWKAGLCEILNFFDGGTVESCVAQEHAPRSIDSKQGSAPTLGLQTPAPSNDGCPGPELADTCGVSEPSTTSTLGDGEQALQRLVTGDVPKDELPFVIETVVSNIKASGIIAHFQSDDGAQKFIDVMDTAIDTLDLTPQVRKKCVKSLYKMCAAYTLLPASLRFGLPVDAVGNVEYRGGSANVLRRECGGQEVAVKALRPHHLTPEEMKNRFCKEVITWKSLRHPNVLPLLGVVMTGTEFVMVSEWMKNGNIKEFTAAHQDANRFELLADVAKGLSHMHSQGMIHGDLKGANILINRMGRACLADFGLLTIAPDVTNVTSSNSFLPGGTFRWMSPELFYPGEFGPKDGRPTKSSDRYALGMVIYEVLRGRAPFFRTPDLLVVGKVLNGERPLRPRGAEGTWFTEDIWNTLECCWRPSPADRPSVERVLRCLERVSGSWTPLPPQSAEGQPTTDPHTWNWDQSSGESMDEDDEPSLSYVDLSRRRPSKVFHSDDQSDDSGLESEGSVADNAPFAGRPPRRATFRRRIGRGFQESSQPRFTSNRTLSLGGPFVAPGVVDTRDWEMGDAEPLGPRHLTLKGIIEEEFSGGVAVRGDLRQPGLRAKGGSFFFLAPR